MASCESCGSETSKVIKCRIEGVELKVCNNCAKFGQIVREKPQFRSGQPSIRKKTVLMVVADAPEQIKRAREMRGMRQIDLAKMLLIKESLLHHIEARQMPLTLNLARKFSEALDLNLVKEFEED